MERILFVSGSPRNGNTDFVLKKVYEKINHNLKEIIYIRNYNIKHCLGCLHCHFQPKCLIEDDMKNLLEKILHADVLVFGTPNYFDNISGVLKDFIDRTHPCYKSAALKDKKTFFIMVGGGDPEVSKSHLKGGIEGFVRYQNLSLINLYCFKALYKNDLTEDDNALNDIKKIISELNQMQNT